MHGHGSGWPSRWKNISSDRVLKRRPAMSRPRNDQVTGATPVSRYPVPRLEDLPSDIRARMFEVQDKAGFIPNIFVALAHRPDEFRAFFAYHDALMLREGGLSKAEREMIVVATSAANDCLLHRRAWRAGAHLRQEPARRRSSRGELSQGRHHTAAES